MPSLEADSYGVPGVAAVGQLLAKLLAHAETLKPTSSIEPPLEKSDFDDLSGPLSQALASTNPSSGAEENVDTNKGRRFAIIETAARETFSRLIATTSIDSPEFLKIWNLFDILSILSDSEQCEPALLFWLVEELLDSQTIAGCRKVFDFLESRRERITAKHFEQKKLVILRMCNELLRRLSRAEDTAFCGRVFIFLFQSFPLGDKSSVNLRGEYHVENVTTFDQDAQAKAESAEKMDVDDQSKANLGTPDPKSTSKDASHDGKKAPKSTKPFEADELYPLFWSLQSYFSQPKKLFDPAHLGEFKTSLDATVTKFKAIQEPPVTKQDKPEKHDKQDMRAEDSNPIHERTSDDDEDELANTFNPKYLTSRDLFELEVSDLTFRRHILVQVLIVIDFLLSLSTQAKEKLNTAKALNKSVMYSDQHLTEEDTKWAIGVRKPIEEYLKTRGHNSEGAYFYRTVDTVLSRDKNWVRWKVENCPSIEMPQVSPQEFNEAKAAARKTTTNKRPYAAVGSLNLDFLTENSDGDVMKRLRSKERCEPPDLMSFKRKIADDDLEIQMPMNNQSKAAAIEGKASKSWRALRIAGRFKLPAFDKIDNPDNIDPVFEEHSAHEAEDLQGDSEEAADPPGDRRPVVFVGPTGIGKSSLIKMLIENNHGVFGKAPAYVTRKAEQGETNGKDYHFVDTQAFSMMRDGDQFIQFTDTEGVNYATSRKIVDAISESGKTPLVVMDYDGAQQVKDFEYAARFVFVKPSSPQDLETRLKASGNQSEKEIEDIMKSLATDLKRADSGDFYDATVVVTADGFEDAHKSLRAFIYGAEGNGEGAYGQEQTDMDEVNNDEPMEDAPANGNTARDGANGPRG